MSWWEGAEARGEVRKWDNRLIALVVLTCCTSAKLDVISSLRRTRLRSVREGAVFLELGASAKA